MKLNVVIIAFYFLCCIYSKNAFGQSITAYEYFEKALISMQTDERRKAIRYANMAAEHAPDFIPVYIFLADVFNINGDKESVFINLQKAFQIDSMYKPEISYKLAIYAYANGKYEEAKHYIDFFEIYADKKNVNIRKYQRLRENIYFSVKAVQNPVPFKPVNLGSSINTRYNEYWPALSADGKVLIFTRLVPISQPKRNPTRTELLDNPDYGCRHCPLSSLSNLSGMSENLYISYSSGDSWSKAMPLSNDVNTAFNEGAACVSSDGKTIIFTACNRPENIGECDLYILFNRDGKWTKPENMKSVNSRYWDSNPSLSFDGKTLYFSSKRPGGIGGKDIWKISIDEYGNATSPAINLGKPINTEYDEVSPFIHPSGKFLYFASNGHVGLGDYDIFYSELEKNNHWGFPVNMGYPINTHKEERSLIVDTKGENAFFASAREIDQGLDIYKFSLDEKLRPEPIIGTKAFVRDYYTQNPIQANIEIVSLEDNKTVYNATSDNLTGEFLIPLKAGVEFIVNISSHGYLFFSERLSLPNDTDLIDKENIHFYLYEIEEGLTVILKNIFFDFDSYNLLPESYSELENVLRFLNDNPKVSVEIGGHTDNVGSKNYNKTLSENRAKAVYNYLIDNNICPNRLEYAGYYFSQPIADNETEAGRSLNRRTEFKITEITR